MGRTAKSKKKFLVSAYGHSDIGLVRENNEDAWAINTKDNIYILADGMGGHLGGEIAARNAVASFSSLMAGFFHSKDNLKNLQQTCEHMRRLIQEVNTSIHQKGRENRQLRGMGTTLCCVYFHEEGLIHAHVGDSRIYRLRNHELCCLTEDHSLVSELVQSGELNAKQAQNYAYKNIITKAIGVEPVVEPAVKGCQWVIDDQFLMCSDGLSDLLSHDEIEIIMNRNSSLEKAAHNLILAANHRGGYDNITVVLLKVQAGNPGSSNERKHLP